jgi:tRNA A-37 threonylcarbamoyl transferase component Bud32
MSSKEHFLDDFLRKLPSLVSKLAIKSVNEDEINYCVCKTCGEENFRGYRYKCLVCEKYDLCSKCFEHSKFNYKHLIEHPVVRFEEPGKLFNEVIPADQINVKDLKKRYRSEIHEQTACNGCRKKQIKGLRFTCEKCDCHLCEACFENTDHNKTHSIIAFGKETSLEIDLNEVKVRQNKILGRGAFGTVYEAIYRDKLVAYKTIEGNIIREKYSKDDPGDLLKSYIREKKAYNTIKSDNVLKMIGHSCIVENQSYELIILTELMTKGSLTSLLKEEPGLSYRRRLDLAVGVARGMSRIHDLGFLHRDIRPANILVNERYVAKIGDMGICKYAHMSVEHTANVGCLSYMPREFYTQRYDQSLDVYTFGLTLNEIYGGTHYFFAMGRDIIIKTKGPVFYELVEKCIDKEPSKRPKSKEIEMELIFFHDVSNRMKTHEYIDLSTADKNHVFVQVYDRTLDYFTTNRKEIMNRTRSA